jgi:hypothetical protein
MTSDEYNELKRRFVLATDYSEFHNYYMSEFFEKDSFRALGKQVTGPGAEQLVRSCCEVYKEGPVTEVGMVAANLREIREYRLVAGTISMFGKMGTVLYFADIHQGMLAVIEDWASGDTALMRFHMEPVAGETVN